MYFVQACSVNWLLCSIKHSSITCEETQAERYSKDILLGPICGDALLSLAKPKSLREIVVGWFTMGKLRHLAV